MVGPTRMRTDLFGFIPGKDLRVATAARLSATFPIISPQARPAGGPVIHCSDGGYFDNSGLVTAMEVIDEFLTNQSRSERLEALPPIAFIEIRAAPSADAIASAKHKGTRGALVNAVLGPFNTLYNARVATQISRTQMEFDLFCKYWKRAGATISRHTFLLSGDLPLSWHLAPYERDLITAHWPVTPGRPPASALPQALGSRLNAREVGEWADAREHNSEQLESFAALWPSAP
jgi:hypothetical protein